MPEKFAGCGFQVTNAMQQVIRLLQMQLPTKYMRSGNKYEYYWGLGSRIRFSFLAAKSLQHL